MLYKEIITFCSEIHTKHTNTLCGQNVEFFCILNLVVHIVTTGVSRASLLCAWTNWNLRVMSHAVVALHQARDMLHHVRCCNTRLSVLMLYALPMQQISFTTKITVARVGSLSTRLRATEPGICVSNIDRGKLFFPSTQKKIPCRPLNYAYRQFKLTYYWMYTGDSFLADTRTGA